jgi:hypothetical protein
MVNIFNKAGADSRFRLLVIALQRGWVQLDWAK